MLTIPRSLYWSAFFFLATICIVLGSPAEAQDVLTYHGDNNRTGWFSSETQLTVANVNQSNFGLLHAVTLDARVDAEPLVATGQLIQGQGTHNVVYVATEADSLYAIDADTGAILWHSHFGIPVPDQYKSGDDNIFPFMGIVGTPVIDRNAGVIYFVSDSINGAGDVFQLHAVSLSTGRDTMNPVAIQFSERLFDGTLWTFNPKYHLQRAGLLEANSSIYVAFGSNGDINPDQSRGSMVRFDGTTLTSQISNKVRTPSPAFYLSSIWQSGYGPAADANGDIFFSTGNSDPYRPTYSQLFNHPDSLMRFSGDLNTLKDSFTTYNYFQLDQGDVDVGSGGMMLLPDQGGSIPHLAVAGGKDGRAFLVNRDNMGGYTAGGPDNILQSISMGSCWCGPAYFVGTDGVARIVTGGNNGVTSWKLQTSPSVQLTREGSTGSNVVSGLPDDGGVIPVVSSNGTTPGTGIVWFVQKPSSSSDQNPGPPVTLMAYSASNLQQQLLSITAGTWTHAVNSNANIVPTVSNGKVYVASNQQLRIFGLLGQPRVNATVPANLVPSAPAVITCPADGAAPVEANGATDRAHQFYGTICQAGNNEIHLALRNGHALLVDTSEIPAHHPALLLTPGRPVHVRAMISTDGVVHAQRISRSHLITPQTPPDR